MRRSILATGAALGVMIGGVAVPTVAAGALTVPEAVAVPSGHKAHEGKRCDKKGKKKVVGNKYHSVTLKCTKVRRGDRHVLVWKYDGRA